MKRRNSESGYALLMIFAMAAVLAITLYTEMPRVAFEAQRDKEQLLIDRGEEYERAVTLFVHKFNRFPGSMEELENTNGQRFLRRRFADPMTGKAEWRLIHAGPGGVLTDSINSKKQDEKDQSTQQNFITDIGLTASSFNQAASGDSVNLATRRRPSDSGGGAAGGADDSGTNNQTSNSGIPGYNGPVMVLPDGRIVPANTSGTYTPPATGAAGASGRISPMPGMPFPPGAIPPGGLPMGGVPPGGLPPGAPGATPGQVNPGLPPTMPSGVAVQQGLPPGAATPGPPGAAASLINQILTSPRQPGGFNGTIGGANPAQLQPGQQMRQPGQQQGQTPSGFGQAPQQAQQQNVVGAGIAGVASKKEGESIKTVNDRTKYNEWEFVYDITKDPTRQGAAGAAGASGGPGRGGPNNPQGINPMPGTMPGGMPAGATPGMIPPGGAFPPGMMPGMPQGPGRGGPGR